MAFQAGRMLLNTSALGKGGSRGMVRVLSVVATEEPEKSAVPGRPAPSAASGVSRRSQRRRQLHVVVASTD